MKTINVPDDGYEWLKEAIAEMKRLYATPDDEVCHEYWDADDIARDVAEYIGDMIEKGEANA